MALTVSMLSMVSMVNLMRLRTLVSLLNLPKKTSLETEDRGCCNVMGSSPRIEIWHISISIWFTANSLKLPWTDQNPITFFVLVSFVELIVIYGPVLPALGEPRVEDHADFVAVEDIEQALVVVGMRVRGDDVIDHGTGGQAVPRQVERNPVLIASVRSAIDQNDASRGAVWIVGTLDEDRIALADVDEADAQEVFPLRLGRLRSRGG